MSFGSSFRVEHYFMDDRYETDSYSYDPCQRLVSDHVLSTCFTRRIIKWPKMAMMTESINQKYRDRARSTVSSLEKHLRITGERLTNRFHKVQVESVKMLTNHDFQRNYLKTQRHDKKLNNGKGRKNEMQDAPKTEEQQSSCMCLNK